MSVALNVLFLQGSVIQRVLSSSDVYAYARDGSHLCSASTGGFVSIRFQPMPESMPLCTACKAINHCFEQFLENLGVLS